MRIYSEKEVAEILKRASEQTRVHDQEPSIGLTIDELRKIGRESGIDPDAIERAALDLDVGGTESGQTNIWGGPFEFSRDVIFDRELGPDDWEAMLPAIRKEFGDPGVVQQRGSVFEWTCSGRKAAATHVSMHPANGRTRLHFYWSNDAEAIPWYTIFIMGTMLSPAIIFDALSLGLIGIPILFAVVGTLFFASRYVVSIVRDRKLEKLTEMTRTIADRLRDTNAEAVVSGGETAAAGGTEASKSTKKEPAPDIELDESEPEAGHSGGRDRTRSRA